MTPSQEKKLDGIMSWMKGNMPKFDWILQQKEDFAFYKHEYAQAKNQLAQTNLKIEELDYRIKALERALM